MKYEKALDRAKSPKKNTIDLPHEIRHHTTHSPVHGAFSVTEEAKIKPVLNTTYSKIGKGYKTKRTSTPTGDYEVVSSKGHNLSKEHNKKIADYLKSIGMEAEDYAGRIIIRKSKKSLEE